jgi:hypothetical protein
MKMLKANLESALMIAIRSQKDYELKANGPRFESVFVAGLKEVLAALQKGERITVEDE